MKSRNMIYVAAAICVASIMSFSVLSTAGIRNIVDFEIEITVDRENNGVKLICIDGCAWETLSFACGPDMDIECRSSIDEYGTPAE